MTTRNWLGAVAVLGMIGCGGGTSGRSNAVETDWVVSAPHSIPAGATDCVEGAYALPNGGAIFFDITDTVGDAMYVSVVPDGSSCDGSAGQSVLYHQNWGGSDTRTTGSLPGGLYDLAVACDNFVEDCIFTVDTFGYLY